MGPSVKDAAMMGHPSATAARGWPQPRRRGRVRYWRGFDSLLPPCVNLTRLPPYPRSTSCHASSGGACSLSPAPSAAGTLAPITAPISATSAAKHLETYLKGGDAHAARDATIPTLSTEHTMPRKFSRFVQPIACPICGRNARPDNGADLCNECYELAGWDNQYNDDGTRPSAETVKHLETYLKAIEKKGGNAQAARDANPYLFAADPALPEASL